MSERIEIPLSKNKITVILVGAIIFVALGILFISQPETFTSSLFGSPQTIRTVGIISVAFFGICLIFIFRKLIGSNEGIIIDENGITDFTNATSVGLIEWDDITGINTIQVASTKILMLQTNNPEKYISRAKNFISKNAMKANHKLYGSPISIVSTSLKISFEELEKLLVSEFQKQKTGEKPTRSQIEL